MDAKTINSWILGQVKKSGKQIEEIHELLQTTNKVTEEVMENRKNAENSAKETERVTTMMKENQNYIGKNI